jgi:hypothetical protein
LRQRRSRFAEDPERAFAAAGPHLLYQANAYIEFGMFGPPDSTPRFTEPQQLLDVGLYRVLDAGVAAEDLTSLIRSGPVVDCFAWTLFPGESLPSAAERLEYIAHHLIPAVRSRLAVSEPQAQEVSHDRRQ